MSTNIVFIRDDLSEQDELRVVKQVFGSDVIHTRSEILDKLNPSREDPVVIPRYSALPYYAELEKDIRRMGARLINSYQEHRFVADIKNWYHTFLDLTPKTWFMPSDVPSNEPGSFVLKGATNSRKHQWRTHMFANSQSDIGKVFCALLDDQLIVTQGIYVRQYEEFVKLGEGVNGMPISDEWRYFILNGRVISGGYYWSSHEEAWEGRDAEKLSSAQGSRSFVEMSVVPRLLGNITFAVADVARCIDGAWRLVELNDGQQSGLSCCDPQELYSALRLADLSNE